MTRESVRRALRTFIITTLALFVPGLLGWLHELTAWANAEGERPFPDGHGLAYLGVSAVVAGVVAVINLAWNAVEDASGHGMLRAVPARPRRRVETGHADVSLFIGIACLVLLIVLIVKVV